MEVRNMKKVMMIFVSVLVLSSVALADDIFPPSWRGANRTVTATFDSWTNFNTGTIDPDTWTSNPPGGWTWYPHASVTGNPVLLNPYYERTNVVYLGSANDKLTFELPNYDQNPLKEVYFQITLRPVAAGQHVGGVNVWASIGGTPLPGYNGDYLPLSLVMASQPDQQGWMTEVYSFNIQPNPDREAFTLNFSSYPAYIDQVVIDTWCIPEPATMLLLAAGAIALRKCRR
jgi:hypothetical protein